VSSFSRSLVWPVEKRIEPGPQWILNAAVLLRPCAVKPVWWGHGHAGCVCSRRSSDGGVGVHRDRVDAANVVMP
jgi:hypothetical protein